MRSIPGTAFGSWAPHIPLVQERLGLGPARLGLALLMIAVGAVIAMPLAGALIGGVIWRGLLAPAESPANIGQP